MSRYSRNDYQRYQGDSQLPERSYGGSRHSVQVIPGRYSELLRGDSVPARPNRHSQLPGASPAAPRAAAALPPSAQVRPGRAGRGGKTV